MQRWQKSTPQQSRCPFLIDIFILFASEFEVQNRKSLNVLILFKFRLLTWGKGLSSKSSMFTRNVTAAYNATTSVESATHALPPQNAVRLAYNAYVSGLRGSILNDKGVLKSRYLQQYAHGPD